MAEVTVKQLADEVGTPVERLLQQMQEARIQAITIHIPHKAEKLLQE